MKENVAMKKWQIWMLPVISGLMLGFSWPEIGDMTLLIFVAFVPLFYMEQVLQARKIQKRRLKIFMGSYISFFLFNFITTWWIYHASLPGMIMAVICNSFFMATVFTFFHLSKRKLGEKAGYISWVFLWLAFEWLHYNWELSWVWLTLGNVFAGDVKWIQWYEYTGVMGGSLWILIVNLIVVGLIQAWVNKQPKKQLTVRSVLLLITVGLPMLISGFIYDNYQEEENAVNIVVVQPNIDPYHEKFYGMPESDQIDLLVQLAETKIDSSTDFVVFPETAFPMGYWEHELEYIYGVEQMRILLKKHPQIRLVIGLSSMRFYGPDEEPSNTARKYNDGTDNHYDYYNTAMHLDTSKNIGLYHKSKLVLGVEKIPFTTLLKPLENLSINLGGASGSLGYEKEPFNFEPSLSTTAQQAVAPIICYESIYGEYIGEYVMKGASLLFIITNDGWWEDTPGYLQHLAYARLRAIEMRRSIARSANTGVSAFINQRGDVSQATKWWTRLAIKEKINASDRITFYAKNGDYIGRVAAFFAILQLVLVLVKSLSKKNQQVI